MVSLMTSCATDTVNGACDDAITSPVDIPSTTEMEGSMRGVGSGDIWFIAPESARWGDVVTKEGSGAAGKFPVWVDSQRSPEITVQGVEGTRGASTIQKSPTAEGLPGPLPVRVQFPGPGCWLISAKGEQGTASIRVRVKL